MEGGLLYYPPLSPHPALVMATMAVTAVETAAAAVVVVAAVAAAVAAC